MVKKVVIAFLLSIVFFSLLFNFSFNNKGKEYIENILSFGVINAKVIFNERKEFNDNKKANCSNITKVGNKMIINLKSCEVKEFLNKEFDYIEFDIENNNIKTFFDEFNLKLVCKEQFDNKTVFYCHSGFLKKEVYLKNFKINFQIVKFDNFIKIGYPIIYTSY